MPRPPAGGRPALRPGHVGSAARMAHHRGAVGRQVAGERSRGRRLIGPGRTAAAPAAAPRTPAAAAPRTPAGAVPRTPAAAASPASAGAAPGARCAPWAAGTGGRRTRWPVPGCAGLPLPRRGGLRSRPWSPALSRVRPLRRAAAAAAAPSSASPATRAPGRPSTSTIATARASSATIAIRAELAVAHGQRPAAGWQAEPLRPAAHRRHERSQRMPVERRGPAAGGLGEHQCPARGGHAGPGDAHRPRVHGHHRAVLLHHPHPRGGVGHAPQRERRGLTDRAQARNAVEQPRQSPG